MQWWGTLIVCSIAIRIWASETTGRAEELSGWNWDSSRFTSIAAKAFS
jgi:hypothetical protein